MHENRTMGGKDVATSSAINLNNSLQIPLMIQEDVEVTDDLDFIDVRTTPSIISLQFGADKGYPHTCSDLTWCEPCSDDIAGETIQGISSCKMDQEDDVSLLGLLDIFVQRMYEIVRKREKDVRELD
ncbi:hypothetical protein Tco_1002663 [Tanacetum coccineum]|uniref:Uncharacterized protein n=1 Tax=Tanacetum coccineum TaxID=301880 RepID=A0ABQ5F885_9ASTR